MLRILLLQVEGVLKRRIEQAANQREGSEVIALSGPEEALEQVTAAPDSVAAVVIGSRVSEPLRLTQRMHILDRSLSVVLLTEDSDEPELRKALQFTPYLGEDVACFPSSNELESVATEVVEAAERRRRRQAYSQTATMMNRRLSEEVGPPQIAGRFGRLLDQAPIGVVTVDEQGGIFGSNRNSQQLLDRPEREVLGQPLSGLFASPEREQVHDHLRQAIRGSDLPPKTFDRSLVKGQPQYLELSAVAVEVGPDKQGAIVLLQDVTVREQNRQERDRVEEALRQQRRWFQATVLSIGDGVIATDAQGRVTLMNHVAEQLTGWAMSEAAGLNSEQVFRIVNETTRATVESPVTRVLREGQVVGLANHTVLIARDGIERPIDDSGAPIRDDKGNVTGAVLVFRDISERRQTERALRESEQRFRAIFDQAAAGIALVGTDGRIGQANERFCQIVGYGVEELLVMADPVATLTHPDDLELDRAYYQSLVKGEQSYYQIEKRYIHKDGHVVWVNLGGSALRDETGEIQQLIDVVEDITERKYTEWALQASEERLRLILDSLTDYAIFTADLQGRITAWNHGAERLLGYAGPEVLGRSVDLIFTPEDREAGIPEKEMHHAMEVGQAGDDRWHVRKDGSRFWANGLMNALGQSEDEPQGFVKILRDQTEAKRSHEQLEARARQQAAVARFGQRALAEPELRHLLDEAAEVVAQTLDLPFCAVLRQVAEANQLEFEAGVGWRPDVVGRARIHAGRDSQAGYTLLAGEPIVTEDLPNETRFARSPLMQEHGVVSGMSVIVAGGEGHPWGILSAHARERRQFPEDDVNFLQAMANILATAIWRSRTEQQLRELNQTLEQRVAERTAETEQRAAQLRALTSELTQTEQRERRRLAQVLHDHLQQMLVAGKLQLGMAAKAMDDEKVSKTLQRVSDLLDESIQESRSLTVELSPPVLYEAGLVAGLEWLGRWMKEQHGLTVELDAAKEADAEGDNLRMLLFQAARELLFNVVKHAEVDRAEITLRRDEDGQIRLSVCDRGQGFDPNAIEQGKIDRGGFGLFNIRERLSWLGGEFDVESAPGQGTCAVLRVPDARDPEAGVKGEAAEQRGVESAEAAATDEPREAAPPQSERIRVVLADDHEIVREGLVGVLNAQPDMEVVGEADDGRAAVELVRRLRPDVVVLDVTMPRMNGIEAARVIASEFPKVRVIGLSVHESADMAEAMRKAGASQYLNKAGPSNRLLAALRNQTA